MDPITLKFNRISFLLEWISLQFTIKRSGVDVLIAGLGAALLDGEKGNEMREKVKVKMKVM